MNFLAGFGHFTTRHHKDLTVETRQLGHFCCSISAAAQLHLNLTSATHLILYWSMVQVWGAAIDQLPWVLPIANGGPHGSLIHWVCWVPCRHPNERQGAGKQYVLHA